VFRITRDFNRRLSDTEFTFRDCPSCRFIWLDPVPRDLAPHYAGRYERPPTSDAEYLARAEGQAERVALMQRFAPGPRLLEIGGDVGLFAHAALRAGFAVRGIEMDASAAAQMRAALGIEVIQTADFASAMPGTPSLDAIALWQVMEHLRDPWRLVEGAARALVPGGVLAFSTPDPECWLSERFGARWLGLDAPRHLCLLREGFVRTLAARHGFEVVHHATDDAEARRLFVYGFGDSLANLCRARPIGPVLYRLGAGVARAQAALKLLPGRLDSHSFVLRKT
jgi:2-polyprenyl-3-methyl-5-hydroxy-6-metoxy-1,4-benzoquinol methylase